MERENSELPGYLAYIKDVLAEEGSFGLPQAALLVALPWQQATRGHDGPSWSEAMTLMEVINRHRVEELKAVAKRLGLPKLNLVQAGKVRIQDKSRRSTDAAVRLLTTAMVVPDFDLELPAEQRDQYTETVGPVRAHAWGVLVQQ